ncbi:hypothetical protein MICRO8M_100217 [Microbacterium sp. 8M]|nr:hypothetical protein MICRO8M_100217 [Microbacterium sp. 8M]
MPPNSTPAASSKETASGRRTRREPGTATSSACAPIRAPVMPQTRSPTAKAVIASARLRARGPRPGSPAPSSTMVPAKTTPSTLFRGPRRPSASRPGRANPRGKRAPRMRASPEFTVDATTRTRPSPRRATGSATVAIRTTDAGPYLSTTPARMLSPYACKSVAPTIALHA